MRPPLVAIVAAVVMASVSGCQFIPGSADDQDVVVGVDLELSGAHAAIGTAYRRALELKVEQLNAAEALGDHKLVLDIKDNKSDPLLSQSNISSFADRSNIAAVIMGACNDCVINSARLLNEKRVPTLALASADAVANPVADRGYLFKLGPNPSDSAAALVRELDRDAGSRKTPLKTALIVTQDKHGQDGREALRSELEKKKERISLIHEPLAIKPTDTDVTEAVQEAVTAKPDSLIIWALPEQAMVASIRARELGFTGRLYLDMAAAGELFYSGSLGDAVMISTQTMAIDDVIATSPAKAARKQWFRDYTARYGGYNGYASFAADAIQLIVNAIKATGGTDRERMRDAIESTQMDGLSGPIRLTPDNHSGLMPQALTALIARNGRWRLVS